MLNTDSKLQELTPNQTQWIAALRSGNYAQTTAGNLHDSKGFCCLGVAAKEFLTDDVSVNTNYDCKDVTRWLYNGEGGKAPKYVIDALGLNSACGDPIRGTDDALTGLNDNGSTFNEIADILEANPGHYFKAIPTVQTGSE
jgi:hypothetical protein